MISAEYKIHEIEKKNNTIDIVNELLTLNKKKSTK